MTSEEWARTAQLIIDSRDLGLVEAQRRSDLEVIARVIREALRQAVLAEREACAAMAERLDAEGGWDAYAAQVAAAIRARPQP